MLDRNHRVARRRPSLPHEKTKQTTEAGCGSWEYVLGRVNVLQSRKLANAYDATVSNSQSGTQLREPNERSVRDFHYGFIEHLEKKVRKTKIWIA